MSPSRHARRSAACAFGPTQSSANATGRLHDPRHLGGDRPQRILRIGPLGTAEMRQQDHLAALVGDLGDGRGDFFDAGRVGDLAVLHRHVEVDAQQHALALEVGVVEPTEAHGGRLGLACGRLRTLGRGRGWGTMARGRLSMSMYGLVQRPGTVALGHDLEVDRADFRRLAGAAERLEPLDADLLGLVHGRLQELARVELPAFFFMVRRIAAVMARRMSVSMFTLRTPCGCPA